MSFYSTLSFFFVTWSETYKTEYYSIKSVFLFRIYGYVFLSCPKLTVRIVISSVQIHIAIHSNVFSWLNMTSGGWNVNVLYSEPRNMIPGLPIIYNSLFKITPSDCFWAYSIVNETLSNICLKMKDLDTSLLGLVLLIRLAASLNCLHRILCSIAIK